MPVPLSLSGKVALITGGSRGIGAATVRLFVAAGAKVVFSYQKARAQAEALAAECGAVNCRAVGSNLSDPESARVLVAEAARHFGRIDILVANHGVWPVEDVAIEKMTDQQWRSTLSINLDAVFGLIKHTVAQMKAQPRNGPAAGHIVLISSTSGQRGEAFHCDYSASKGALISMTKSLSTELASAGIYVNSVARVGWGAAFLERRQRFFLHPTESESPRYSRSQRFCRMGLQFLYWTSLLNVCMKLVCMKLA